ncbi:putative epoxide hydrolase [Fusarium oxysporum f. sp. raphani]|uniref:Putative epoxide hydrolase n=1 Tax=Fusarium oxysporum f. sp. raphani TaxID=96318 RepID=A0A8J5P468_FUSOX|nr:putative epoxide hydrolase [Fusarium oxysporum f. sp. raphani]
MADQDFTTLPHPVASEVHIKQFQITVPSSDIEKLHLLLDNSPIPDRNWENSQGDDRFGTTRDWVIHAVKEWRHNYNWKQWEHRFNSYPQYTADVTDDDGQVYTIHFNALFSKNKNALPILFLHGWPGSAVQFLPMLDIVNQRYPSSDSLPYHILVPDLIGFGFSSGPPLDKDFNYVDNARILVKLMHIMGFTSAHGGYVVQGGDLGGIIAPKVAALDPESCRLVHVNILFIPPPEGTNVKEDIRWGRYTDAEIDALSRGEEFVATGFAYAAIQGTRPGTLGLAFGSSPIALLSWIGEKFLQWSDPETKPSLELILTNVSLYWFSKCYPTSIWQYRLMVSGASGLGSPFDGVQCPFAYSWFRREICNPPKYWLDRIGKVKWYRHHERGGHFASLEQPEALWDDVVDSIADSGLQPRI